MGTGGAKAQPTLGFLTVVEDNQFGLCGGYLLLNLSGRPLEFHCTSPIKANRAQQILYGPTLGPYLYGEQIGQSLVAKSSLDPLVIYTDTTAVMALRQFIATPAALVLRDEEADQGQSLSQSNQWRVDAPHASTANPIFSIGRNQLAVAESYPKDRAEIESRLQSTPDLFDLAEPFERIREAIEEARGSGK